MAWISDYEMLLRSREVRDNLLRQAAEARLARAMRVIGARAGSLGRGTLALALDAVCCVVAPGGRGVAADGACCGAEGTV